MRKREAVVHRTKIPIKDCHAFMWRSTWTQGGDRAIWRVRTTETRHAQWTEFEGLGGPKPLWCIPAERMKMRVLRQYLILVIGNKDDLISSNRMLVLL